MDEITHRPMIENDIGTVVLGCVGHDADDHDAALTSGGIGPSDLPAGAAVGSCVPQVG